MRCSQLNEVMYAVESAVGRLKENEASATRNVLRPLEHALKLLDTLKGELLNDSTVLCGDPDYGTKFDVLIKDNKGKTSPYTVSVPARNGWDLDGHIPVYTGFKDKNDHMIFTGDMIWIAGITDGMLDRCRVFWSNKWNCFALETAASGKFPMSAFSADRYELVKKEEATDDE
jgi:hypothetical protein